MNIIKQYHFSTLVQYNKQFTQINQWLYFHYDGNNFLIFKKLLITWRKLIEYKVLEVFYDSSRKTIYFAYADKRHIYKAFVVNL